MYTYTVLLFEIIVQNNVNLPYYIIINRKITISSNMSQCRLYSDCLFFLCI